VTPAPYAARAAADFCTCPRDADGARIYRLIAERVDEYGHVIEDTREYTVDPACPLHGRTRQEAPF